MTSVTLKTPQKQNMRAVKRLRKELASLDCTLKSVEETAVQSAVSGPNCIVTHNGTFHCDEALACGLLKCLPAFRDFSICRTRDEKLIKEGGIVVDVGATFDLEAKRFDHHQRGFDETFRQDYSTKLSSAGLVYKYYGKAILEELAQSQPLSEKQLQILEVKMYEEFIEHIDGIDNGVESVQGGNKVYRITTSLPSRVGHLFDNNDNENERFKEAMELTLIEFCESFKYLWKEWLPAREVVEQAMAVAPNQVHPSGEILHLDQSVPWKSHLVDIEKTLGCQGKFKFCLFTDSSGNWRVQAIPPEGDNSFAMRIPLKKEWQGLREEALCTASGIEGCIFVHASGFIGGNKTYQGALQMAVACLQ